MNRTELRAAVLQALSDVAPELDAATLRPDRPIREQIDIDSYDFLNVIVALHARLGVDVPERDYQALATLDGAVVYLADRLGLPQT